MEVAAAPAYQMRTKTAICSSQLLVDVKGFNLAVTNKKTMHPNSCTCMHNMGVVGICWWIVIVVSHMVLLDKIEVVCCFQSEFLFCPGAVLHTCQLIIICIPELTSSSVLVYLHVCQMHYWSCMEHIPDFGGGSICL